MRYRLKFGSISLLTLIMLLVMQPAISRAADDLCFRIIQGQSPVYSVYNLSTQSLTRPILVDKAAEQLIIEPDVSPDGTMAAALVMPTQIAAPPSLRFINTQTQAKVDIPLRELSVGFSQDSFTERSLSGWSSDSAYYAMTAYNPETSADVLTIFSKDGQKVAEIPYKQPTYMTAWSWAPQGHRLAFLNEHDDQTTGLSILSVTGEIVDAQLQASLSTNSPIKFVWSPDGHYIGLGDEGSLSVIDTSTGAVTDLEGAYLLSFPQPFWWSPNHQAFFFPMYHDTGLVLERYDLDTGAFTVVTDFVLNYEFLPRGLAHESDLIAVIKTNADMTAQEFLVIDGLTGETHMLAQSQDTSNGVYFLYQWSPQGDVLWVGADKTSVVRMDDMTPFELPVESLLLKWKSSIHWSPNGEWVGFTTFEDLNADSFTLWILNTKTGISQMIREQSTYADVIPNDEGAAFIVEAQTLSPLPPGSSEAVPFSERLLPIEDPLVYPQQGAAAWSPDGITGVFLESGNTSTESVLKTIHSSGEVLHEVTLPWEDENFPMYVSSIRWVPCP